MSLQNIARNFARLSIVYAEYKIENVAHIFNLHESGCSVWTAYRSRTKEIFTKSTRANAVDMKWSANVEHVTLMPVCSADGKVYSPVVILPEKDQKEPSTTGRFS